ncbi:MAG: prepilin-type N-terminal cleavage/methylation domain-containing protein [Gemmatimonadota bacterium]
MTRRGFSLVEMMVSVILLCLVAGIAIRVLLRLNWSSTAAGERGALQASLRGGALYLTGELRELGGTPLDPDILVFAPESLTYRAMRGSGVACRIANGQVSIELTSLTGYRSPQPGRDSLLLHQENNEWAPADDRWLHLPIGSLSGGTCGGSPALTITTPFDTTAYPLHTFASFAPLRTFEIMQIRLYQSGGDYWLGTRSVSGGEIIQPVIGPLSSRGLAMTYFDSLGGAAVSAGDIRSIGFTLRGLTAPVRTGGGYGSAARLGDSLLTRVLLRNW